jgi:hypothetical protein
MAGFNNIKEFVDAELDGKSRIYSYRKSPVQTTVAGLWFDLSMSPGNPVPQYYAAAPMVSQPLKQSTDGGLYHGATTGSTKYLKSIISMSNSATGLPMPMILLDYIMFYPFVDEGTTDPQATTNSTALPRYTDGKGVQVMAISVAGRTGGQTFNFSYTNSDGVAGRTSQTVIQNTSTAIGTIVTSAITPIVGSCGPFIGLQAGDTGVRSIDSVQMISGPDVGLFTLVMVKPLITSQILEQTAPVEESLLIEKGSMPEIKDDAYLNWICLPNGSLSGVSLFGMITTNFT